jgi:spermidine/putrescine transport system substrate-binding protein
MAVPNGVGPSQFGRRTFLRGLSLSALAVAGGELLSSCGTPSAIVPAGSCVSHDKSATEKVLQFDNWPQYIDPSTSKRPSTLDKFEEATGISVTYIADVNDNESFFAKVADQLARCTSTSKDMFVLTDWMAGKMVSLGWLQKLDHQKMPNVTKNMLPSLRAPLWDPHRDYSVPWQSGMTGICYNSELTDPVHSFEEMLTRPDLKGKIDLLTEMRDTMLFMLLIDGADPADFTLTEFEKGIDRLQKAVSDGQVRRFTGNDYLDDLRSGNVVACESWSGDIPQLGDPKFKWVAPEEGFAIWSDNMLVPNLSPHKANAEALMNFYYQPEIAAQLEAWNYYFCPVLGAGQYIGEFDKAAVDDPLIFPSEEFLKNAHQFMSLGTDEKQYTQLFSQTMTG